jgi:hypothetical protein
MCEALRLDCDANRNIAPLALPGAAAAAAAAVTLQLLLLLVDQFLVKPLENLF